MIVLAGDVGGTKTLLSAVEVGGPQPHVLLEERYVSADFPEFADLVRAFLARLGSVPVFAVLGIAGPVVERKIKGTNLPWVVDEAALEGAFEIFHVQVINDFAAAARGVLQLGPKSLLTLQPGTPETEGAIGILGAGTGLGEAVLSFQQGQYVVVPTEAGHADFGPRTDEEIEVLRDLRGRFGRVSYERLLSGPGIYNLYQFVRGRGHHPESPEVARALNAGDPAAIVTSFDGRDPLCTEALDLFVSVYGAEAGNLALRAVATRGVYVAGGIAPRMPARFQDGRFQRAFVEKGRHRQLMERIPVHLVTDTRVGLLGALSVAEALALQKTQAQAPP